MADVRHLARNIEQRLLAKVEFLRQRDLVRRQDPQPLLEIIEATGDRESCRRENYRIEMLEKLFAQDFAHVDRRGGEEDSSTATLVPIDVTVLFALEKKREFATRLRRTARQRDNFFRLRRNRRQLGLDALHGRREIAVRLMIAFEKSLPLLRPEGISAFA